MKFRVVKETKGSLGLHDSYYVQQKKWWGWSTVSEFRCGGFGYGYTHYFEFPSFEEAERWINEWYPETTTVIKEITV